MAPISLMDVVYNEYGLWASDVVSPSLTPQSRDPLYDPGPFRGQLIFSRPSSGRPEQTLTRW